MIKLFRMCLTALLLAPFGALHAATLDDTGSVRLRYDITVGGTDIRLRDIFENVGASGDVIVGRAPAPGRRRIYSGRQIAAVARAHGLAWRPLFGETKIGIKRAGRRVERATVIGAINRQLVERGAGEYLRIETPTRDLALFQAADQASTLEVEILDFDAATRRFQALVKINSSSHRDSVRVVGRAYRIVEVPVLRAPLARGRIIRADDVEWQNVRISRLANDAIRDIGELTGQAAKRRLRAGAPLRRADLQPPVVIAKGTLVTIRLAAPGLQLTATGRALEDGSDGAIIRIVNLYSKRTVQGAVVDAKTVRVAHR